MQDFKLGIHELIKNKSEIDFLNEKIAKNVLKFHKSIPGYKETPLVNLDNLSEYLGINKLYVKDESYRFDLNAFKVLGGSYCIGKYLGNKLGLTDEELIFNKIASNEAKEKIGDIVFTTATDGNHGRGIARAANKVGQKSKVFMPQGTVAERLENIRKLGADAEIYDMNYDDCVREANNYANKNGGALVQDTSWEGYEEIPKWIMQGYITFAYESYLKMKEDGNLPSHIFLQAGVGSMAAAIIGFFANVMKDNPPKFILVEPSKVDPFFRSIKENDGNIHAVTGELDSIMAGLCCGEPATIAWDIISSYVEYFISCDDVYAAHGMRVLGNTIENDQKIISGESGAVTTGVVSKLMIDEKLEEYRKKIGLEDNSIVYCVSTEGDTDKKGYRKIVWDGKYPS